MDTFFIYNTPLGVHETYTSDWFTNVVNTAYDLHASVETDADGDLYVDFSDDGGDTVSNTQPNNHWAIDANLYGSHIVHPRGKSFRFRIVNGSSAQSYLRLVVKSGKIAGPTIVGVDQQICHNTDSILARVSDNPLDIARDLYVNKKLVHLPGYNSDVDGAEDVWDTGGDFTFATEAQTIQIVSTSDEDDKDSGDGVQNVTIHGLDENYELAEETIDLEGMTPVVSTGTFIHVHEVTCGDVGTVAGSNIGTITVQQSSSGIVFTTIPPNIGVSGSTAFWIPVTHEAIIVRFGGSLLDINANNAILAIWQQEFGKAYQITHRQNITTSGYSQIDFFAGHILPPRTKVKLTILGINNTNADISADYDMFLVWD